MRREVLEPDGQGRIALASLGFADDEPVVAQEIQPGQWMLMSQAHHHDVAADAASDPAREEEQNTGFAQPTESTVNFGRSVSRVERPANMPPPGKRR